MISGSTATATCLSDLSVLQQPQVTGIQRFTTEVADRLAGLPHRYRLSGIGCAESRAGAVSLAVDVDLPWSQVEVAQKRLALAAYATEADLLWSPYYPVPPRRSCPAVQVIHDLIPLEHPEWFPSLASHTFFDVHVRAAARSAERIVTVSRATAMSVQKHYGIPAERIAVAPLASFLSPELIANESGDDEVLASYGLEGPFLFSLGTLEPRKNLPRLIDACCRLFAAEPDLRMPLVLAGGTGWKEEGMQARLAEWRKQIDLRLLGRIPDTVLPALFRRATLFAYPSLMEGFGLPVVEALSCGAMVLTSDSSSLPEVGGEAVLYVDPIETDSIVESLRLGITDRDLRERLQSVARERASQFSWDRTASIIAGELGSLL